MRLRVAGGASGGGGIGRNTFACTATTSTRNRQANGCVCALCRFFIILLRLNEFMQLCQIVFEQSQLISVFA